MMRNFKLQLLVLVVLTTVFLLSLSTLKTNAQNGNISGKLIYRRIGISSTELVGLTPFTQHVFDISENNCTVISPNGVLTATMPQNGGDIVIRRFSTEEILFQYPMQGTWASCIFYWLDNTTLRIKVNGIQEYVELDVTTGQTEVFSIPPSSPPVYSGLPGRFEDQPVLPSTNGNYFLYERCQTTNSVTTSNGEILCANEIEWVIYPNQLGQDVVTIDNIEHIYLDVAPYHSAAYATWAGVNWSPNDQYLAYVVPYTGLQFPLRIVNTSTGQTITPDFVNIDINMQQGFYWSPDSQKLGFWVLGDINNPESFSEVNTFIVFDPVTNTFTIADQARTAANTNQNSYWSPDSDSFAYIDESNELVHINSTTGVTNILDTDVSSIELWVSLVHPIVDAGLDQTVVDANGDGIESITLDATLSSDSDGIIVDYEWSENSTILASGITPQVSLTTGTHNIILTVTDDDGAMDSDEVIVTIESNVQSCNSDISASTTIELINAINTANNAGTPCTIDLDTSGTYTLTAVDNTSSNGANGLPVITGEITINGHNASIVRDSAAPQFRLFEVQGDGFLVLLATNLSGGDAGSNNGGAVLNNGIFGFGFATITGNHAYDGGAVYNTGVLAIGENSSLTHNIADNRGGAVYTTSTTTAVSYNCISGNQAADTSGVYSSVATFNATQNDWGSANGPGGAGPGSGDEVNANVDFSNFTATRCSSSPTTNNFTLINADTDQPIVGYDPISAGAQIDVQNLPTLNLNMRANVTESNVDYVIFDFNGTSQYNLEYEVPYALAQDFSGDYLPFTPPLGQNTVTATPYISGVAGTPFTLNFEIIDSSGSGSSAIVNNFTLINADTDQPIAAYDPIVSGSTIDLASLSTQNLNIRANTTPPTIGRVEFDYNGTEDFRIEGVAPYALGGDNSGNYNIMQLPLGLNTLVATPYTISDVQGFVQNVNFTVTDSSMASQSLTSLQGNAVQEASRARNRSAVPTVETLNLPFVASFDTAPGWRHSGNWTYNLTQGRNSQIGWVADASPRNTENVLELPVAVYLDGNTQLRFWHRGTAFNQDTVALELLIEGTDTWNTLDVFSAIPTNWTQVTVNLAPYRNEAVRLRWRIITGDATSTSIDYAVDDLEIRDRGQ